VKPDKRKKAVARPEKPDRRLRKEPYPRAKAKALKAARRRMDF
jgi:hypothetical protein